MLTHFRRVQRRASLWARARAGVRGRAVGVPSFSLPTGKGMFVRTLSGAGTPEQMVARAKSVGLRWVAIWALWQHPDQDKIVNQDELGAHTKALRAAGIDVWVWGFPERSRRASFAEIMAKAAFAAGASGILIDAEAPWIGATDAQALDLVQQIRAAAPGRLVGLTSYGNAAAFDDFPWTAFASVCDVGVPQVYHGHVTLGLDYQGEAVAYYQQLGFPAVIPALAAWDLSVPEILEIHARTPRPIGAVIWWDWYLADEQGTWPAIAQAGSAPTDVSMA